MSKQAMARLRIITPIIAFLVALGCGHKDLTNRPDDAQVAISNNDIEWDGDYIGLRPTIAKGSSVVLASVGNRDSVPQLIARLKRADQFVAAHVLLTEISGVQYTRNASHWNGMAVELLASGKVVYRNEDMPLLWQAWHEWLANGMPSSGIRLTMEGKPQ